MLRICLSGPPNRRKQPERYAQYALKLVEKIKFIKNHTKNIPKKWFDIIKIKG
jgi:hypothetical protein